MKKKLTLYTSLLIILSSAIIMAAVRPDHSIISAGSSLTINGDYIYTSAGKTLYRLDRKTRDFSAVYTGRNYLYRYAVNSDNTKALCYFEGEPFIHYLHLQKGPARAVRITLNIPQGFSDSFEYLYFDKTGRYAVLASSAHNTQRVAFYADLQKPGSSVNVLSGGGAVITAAGPDLLYMTYSEKEYSTYKMAKSESIIWKNIFTGAEKKIYVFESLRGLIEFEGSFIRPGAYPVETGSPYHAGIRIFEPGKGTDRILLFKDGTGTPFADIVSPKALDGNEFFIEKIFLPAEGDKLILCVRLDMTDGFLTFISVDLKTGKSEKASDSLMEKVRFNTNYRQYGNTLKGLLWRHDEGSDNLLLVDVKKRTWSLTSIKPFAKAASVEWGGLTYFYPDPDEFYTGIEKGGGRYFMKFPLNSLKTPAEPLPEGVSPFEFIQTGGR